MAAPGRKALPEGRKKQKLTLTVKPENYTYLNTYCNTHNTSISQLLDGLAEQLRDAEQRAAAKAAKEARRAGKPLPEEQLPGQRHISEYLLD